MEFKRGEQRGSKKLLLLENGSLKSRPVHEWHEHRPPFGTRIFKEHELPNCMVFDTGHSNRGKNVLHIYYDREQQQPEVSEELLFRSRQLLRVMWVVGILMMLDILIRI